MAKPTEEKKPGFLARIFGKSSKEDRAEKPKEPAMQTFGDPAKPPPDEDG